MTDFIVIDNTSPNAVVLQEVTRVIEVQAQGPKGDAGATSGTAALTSGTIDGVVIGGSSAAAATITDLAFSGNARRIRGLMDSSLHANRLLFQTSTLNGKSSIGVIPNGSGTGAFVRTYNSSDPDNSTIGQMLTNSTGLSLNVIKTGTGAILPMSFQIDSVEGMRLDTNGNVGIGGLALSGYRLEVTKTVDGPHAIIVRNDSAGTLAQSILQLTNNTKYVNFTAGFNSNFLSISGGGGIVTAFSSFDTHIWRNNAGTERAKIDSNGNLVVHGAGGLGYGTGAGGAVTQTGSRGTAVNIDKTSGAITLFTAAGSATEASFTVNNNKVAATDVVVVAVKSGTNRYLAWVTGVATGSFDITFKTTGGTASDAPVINFAVIKAVTA